MSENPNPNLVPIPLHGRSEKVAGLFKRRLVVYPKIQIPLICYTIIVSMVTVMVHVLTNFVLSRAYSGTLPVPLSVAQLLVLISGAVSIGFISFVQLKFTNRVVGPIFRLMRHMDLVGRGTTPPDLKFRKDDQFSELAEQFNAMLLRLRSEDGSLSTKRD